MIGTNASKVVLDTKGIEDRHYSCERFHDWSERMSAAIDVDLHEYSWPDHTRESEAVERYTFACEEVIKSLLFEVKWLRKKAKRLNDDSFGNG